MMGKLEQMLKVLDSIKKDVQADSLSGEQA